MECLKVLLHLLTKGAGRELCLFDKIYAGKYIAPLYCQRKYTRLYEAQWIAHFCSQRRLGSHEIKVVMLPR